MAFYTEQLRELQQQVARKEHLETMLKDLRSQRIQLDDKVLKLQWAKEREQKDVDKLEGRSLAKFFYSVVGKQEEKLDKEKQEAYAAVAKYDAAVKELEAVEEDIKKYEEELSPLKGCDERYEQALEEKKQSVKASGTSDAENILKLEEQLLYLDNQTREIKEAMEAGRKADSKATEVINKLDSAKGWGTWDVIGGGLISDIAKHSALDDAQGLVEQLQVRLRRFKTELADVTIHADMQVNVEGFLRFADYFFDNIFTDWAVLDRIKESMHQVDGTKLQIKGVLNKLSAMLTNIENEQAQVKAQLEETVVNAKV